MADLIDSTVVRKGQGSLGDALTSDGMVVGRHYTLYAKIGVGGMASVYLGWLAGAADFSRIVAIKRMHPQFAIDEQFAARFRDEARLSARLCHPNIVQVFDVVERSRELLIVMEYVHGISLGALVRDAKASGSALPIGVMAGVLVPALHGLHAAHEATDDDGRPMGIVHRDFSPQNIMVSSEGHSKILDFGIAKASTHLHVTSTGEFSGKIGYCSPEQIAAGILDRRSDVFAAGIVLWEMLTGDHLFYAPGLGNAQTIQRVLERTVAAPSSINPEVPRKLDDVVLRALDRDASRRYPSARELAFDLEAAIDIATPPMIAEWVERIASNRMARLTRLFNDTRRRMGRHRAGLISQPTAPDHGVAEAIVPEQQGLPAETVAEHVGRGIARSRRKGPILVLTVLALAAGILFGRRIFRSPSTPAVAVQLAPPTVSALPPPPPPVPVSAAPASPAQPSEAPPATIEPPPGKIAHPSARPAKGRPMATKARSRPVKAPAKAGPKPSCAPPWYLDAEGIRIFKEECL